MVRFLVERLIPVTALFALLPFTGCVTKSDEPVDVAEKKEVISKLRIGVTPDSPPLIFKDGGRYRGIEADLARSFASALNREPVFVEMPFAELIDALLTDKIDIVMSGMSITRERSTRANFARPYLRVGQLPMVKRERAEDLAYNLPGFDGKIGVVTGTTGDFFVQRQMRKATRVTFDTPDDAVKALLRDRIDIFVYDAPVIWWLASENESKGLTSLNLFLTEEYLAWAVAKENLWLFAEANRFIEQRTADGTIPQLIEIWMPLPGTP